MINKIYIFRLVSLLALITLTCGAVPGLSSATPTLWILVPPASTPLQSISSPPALAGTPAATNPPVDQKEISILRCQNNPSTGILPIGTSVVLVWGWATDNESKRQEIISISSFTLKVDGVIQDISKAVMDLETDNVVFWKLSIGVLPGGTHEVILHPTLSRNFTESSGSYQAGPQPEELCELKIDG